MPDDPLKSPPRGPIKWAARHFFRKAGISLNFNKNTEQFSLIFSGLHLAKSQKIPHDIKTKVMQTVTNIREGADDICADAKSINDRRAEEAAPEVIEDAE